MKYYRIPLSGRAWRLHMANPDGTLTLIHGDTTVTVAAMDATEIAPGGRTAAPLPAHGGGL